MEENFLIPLIGAIRKHFKKKKLFQLCSQEYIDLFKHWIMQTDKPPKFSDPGFILGRLLSELWLRHSILTALQYYTGVLQHDDKSTQLNGN